MHENENGHGQGTDKDTDTEMDIQVFGCRIWGTGIGGRTTLKMLRRKRKTQFVKQERNRQNAIAPLNYLKRIAPQQLMLRTQVLKKFVFLILDKCILGNSILHMKSTLRILNKHHTFPTVDRQTKNGNRRKPFRQPCQSTRLKGTMSWD